MPKPRPHRPQAESAAPAGFRRLRVQDGAAGRAMAPGAESARPLPSAAQVRASQARAMAAQASSMTSIEVAVEMRK